MDNKEFARLLEKRTLEFSLAVIRFCSTIPSNIEYNVIKNQLVKSATSVGANYREANRSESRADFKHKIALCTKEASETQYWLEILMNIQSTKLIQLKKIFQECSELLAIFTSIGKTARSK
jgi:four helix bundle protein